MAEQLQTAFFAEWVDDQFFPYPPNYQYVAGRNYCLKSYWLNNSGKPEVNINRFIYRGDSSRHLFDNPHLIQRVILEPPLASITSTIEVIEQEGTKPSGDSNDKGDDDDQIVHDDKFEMSGGGGESTSEIIAPPPIPPKEDFVVPADVPDIVRPVSPVSPAPVVSNSAIPAQPDAVHLRGGCGSRTQIIIIKSRSSRSKSNNSEAPKPEEPKKAEEKAIAVPEKEEEKKEEKPADGCGCGCDGSTPKVSYTYMCQAGPTSAAPPVVYCAPACPLIRQYVCYPTASHCLPAARAQYSSNGTVCYWSS